MIWTRSSWRQTVCVVKQLLDPGSAVGEMIMKPTKFGDLKLASSKVIRNWFSKIESSKINGGWRIIRISILWVLIFDLIQNFELRCKVQTGGSLTPCSFYRVWFGHVWFKVSCLKTCRFATLCDTVCLNKNIQILQNHISIFPTNVTGGNFGLVLQNQSGHPTKLRPETAHRFTV